MIFSLVLLETSGNQDYLFRTNMLRDNVGASELTYRAGTLFVLDAINAATGAEPLGGATRPKPLRAALRDESLNPPIENGGAVEVVVCTSGKAILLARDRATAQKIIRNATTNALLRAPGIDLAGCHVDVEIDDLAAADSLGVFARAVSLMYREFGRVQAARTSQKSRFSRLPIVAPCRASGDPAFTLAGLNEEISIDLSRGSNAKWDVRKEWISRLREICPNLRFPEFKDLEDRLRNESWLAVLHADGNGIGKIFMEFEKYIPQNAANARGYIDQLRAFSIELEEATEEAFSSAVQKTWAKDVRGSTTAESGSQEPFIAPLILGGDDLTAVCEGRRAVDFACSYLRAFERETRKQERGVVRSISKNARNQAGLLACAGVAVIKPHYPFHSAYHLAEELLKSAKKASRRLVSAVDYHILFDSTFSTLDQVRKRLLVDNGRTSLTARPYAVVSDPSSVAPSIHSWAEAHCIGQLKARTDTLRRQGEDRPAIPRSQAHDVKEGLYLGRAAADARMRLIRNRYQGAGFDRLLEETEGGGSLFREVDSRASEPSATVTHETRFLDALELAGLGVDE